MHRATAYLARDFARFYDWIFADYHEDLPFYLALAGRYGGPLLELACGTGRLTILLARQGFAITGLDISAEMLGTAREKLRHEPPEVRARVQLHQADMCSFERPDRANLAFIPFSSLFHVHDRSDVGRCLSSIRRHLRPGGALVVDLAPAEQMAHQTVGEMETYKVGVSPDTGKLTKQLGRRLSISEPDQRVTVEHTYLEVEADGSESRYVFVEEYTWRSEGEMRALLCEAGFAGVTVFGGYGFEPYDEASARVIFLTTTRNDAECR